MDNKIKQTISAVVLIGILSLLGGCATDENPISPQKMSELRKQEGDQRANFNPDMNKTK